MTFPADSPYQCNYKQTKRLVPFLLQLFLGLFTGVGSLMLGQLAYGVSQVLLFWIGFVLFTVLIATQSKELATCYACMALCAIIGLEVTILVKIGEGSFTDKNGAPMGGW